MYFNRFSRRMFLKGAGGISVAIPLLPSLVEKAYGQTTPVRPRFVAVRSWYGQTFRNWNPSLDANQMIASDVWVRDLSQFTAPINRVLGTRFDPLKAKLTMMMGLDVLGTPDHNESAFLNASHSSGPGQPPVFPWSVDSILEKSASFYPTPPPVRVLRVSPGEQNPYYPPPSFSWTKENGVVRQNPFQRNEQPLFDQLFSGITNDGRPSPSALRKGLVIDHVMEDYRRLMASTKISSQDRNSFSNYVDMLRDLQIRIRQAPPMSCSQPGRRLFDTKMETHYSNHIDMVVMALACGLTKAVCFEIRHFQQALNYDGSYFHGSTHEDSLAQDAKSLAENTWISDRVLELMNKMDAIVDPDGRTMLDNSVVFWGNELGHGQAWHRTENMPVLIAGSAGGKLRTGYLIDYRQKPFRHIAGRGDFPWCGRPYNQLLITLMQAMGLTDSEWEQEGQPGFGDYTPGSYGETMWTQYLTNRRARLPFYPLG